MKNPSNKYISGILLTEKHVGERVTYVPKHVNGNVYNIDCEIGIIKSWNEGGVFVDYLRNVARTSFEDLIFGSPPIELAEKFIEDIIKINKATWKVTRIIEQNLDIELTAISPIKHIDKKGTWILSIDRFIELKPVKKLMIKKKLNVLINDNL